MQLSPFFTTLFHDPLPHGGHSILRAAAPDCFCNFGIIWDADHDHRVLWIAEQLYARGLLSEVLFLGESTATVWFYTTRPPTPALERALQKVCDDVPDDVFNPLVQCLDDVANAARLANPYSAGEHDELLGLRARWALGRQPLKFSFETFGPHITS